MQTATQTKAFAEAVFETRSEQARNAAYESANCVKHPLIARMDEIGQFGRYDRDADGLNRRYDAWPNGEHMRVQILAWQGDLLFLFWSADESTLRRRLLVTADAEHWLEVDETAIRKYTKYSGAAVTLQAQRLFGREGMAN